jgi:hypothetical protein
MRTDGDSGREACPKERMLRDFFVGNLPAETANIVGRHLECCSACAATLGALAVEAKPFGEHEDGPAAFLAHPELQRMIEKARLAPLLIEKPLFRQTQALRAKISLPGYTELEPLSPGAGSRTYRARCDRTGRDAAARFVPVFAIAGRALMSRCQRSTILVARATGGRILPITDIVLAGERIAFIRPFIKAAISLDRIIRDARRPPVEQALRWLDQLIDHMAAVHAAGECYPELRPSNVLIDREDAVWLTDFGIARVLSPSAQLLAVDHLPVHDEAGSAYLEPSFRVGHAGYVAPEEWSGQGTPVRSGDVFRIGAAAYHALTLRLPYPSIATEKQRPLAVRTDIFPTGLKPELERLILRSLDPRPNHRYRSAGELAADWRRFRQAPSPGG